MKRENLKSWRVPIIVITLVCLGIGAFILVQCWNRGRLPNSEVLDLSIAQTIQENTHRGSLSPQVEETYHYEFFELLEQPVPDRALPELEMKQNPAITAKYRQGLNRLAGKFAIQLAVFKSSSDAQSLVRDLNVTGYHAIVIDTGGNYVVRVEAGSKRETAESVLLAVEKSTGYHGAVVSL